MPIVRSLIGASLTFFIVAPLLAFSQGAPYSQVAITTQTAPGVSAPTTPVTVTVTATNPSLAGGQYNNGPTLSFPSNFTQDVHLVNFVPGSYSVAAQGGGYYYSYSPDCSGFTSLYGGSQRSCVITLSTTPPPTPGCGYPYGYNCAPGLVPYPYPILPSVLSCAPSYQTVAAGNSVTVSALGGGSALGYNWQTAERSYLNTGANLTFMPQTTGVQTVIVSYGAQTASCTVNIVPPAAGPVVYTPTIPTSPAPVIVPSAPVVTGPVTTYTPTYVPATKLPNTGYAPLDSSEVALILSALVGALILTLPYARKALTATAA